MKKNSEIKLNVGASPIWRNDDWYTLDHKYKKTSKNKILGDAEKINLKNNSCKAIFCSHVFEHIPHVKLPSVLSEFNRVLKKDGIVRILTPDLEKIANAYVKKDYNFFKKAKKEDESIRTDLDIGGMFMNFIVSPGQDTALLNRSLNKFIAGYAHVYSYDYKMLSILLKKCGFKSRKAKFCDSKIKEMKVPLHVNGLKKNWENFNQKFYNNNNLIHKFVDGKYKINFTVSGFDRDPLTSLIIEAKKIKNVNKMQIENFFNNSKKNYNLYAFSLNKDKEFKKNKLKKNIK